MQPLKLLVQISIAVGDNVRGVCLLLFLGFHMNTPVFLVVGVLEENAGAGVAQSWSFPDLRGALSSERWLCWVD